VAADVWSVAFGSRPGSGPISLRDCRDVVIENRTFRDLGANVIAIRLERCTNVTIRANDFINVSEGVYAVASSNIRIIDNRYQNITGPYERVGLNRANFVQFDSVNGGLIDHNKGRCGDTEDIVSLYKTSNVIVEDNQFEGVASSSPGCLAWRSSSGSAIALGDDGGSGNTARRNIVITPGQVGIFIAGGLNHQMTDNIVIGEQRDKSNVGMYVWNAYPYPCSGQTVSGNRVYWRKADGALNGFWNGGNCGSIAGTGNNWADTSLDVNRYRVSL